MVAVRVGVPVTHAWGGQGHAGRVAHVLLSAPTPPTVPVTREGETEPQQEAHAHLLVLQFKGRERWRCVKKQACTRPCCTHQTDAVSVSGGGEEQVLVVLLANHGGERVLGVGSLAQGKLGKGRYVKA